MRWGFRLPLFGHGMLIVVSLLILVLAGCTQNQFTAQGGWAGGALGKDEMGDDLLYIGTQEGTLIALKARQDFLAPSERLLGNFPSESGAEEEQLLAIYGTPVLAGGHVLFGAYNGVVYSLDSSNPKSWGAAASGKFPTEGPIVGGTAITEIRSGETLVLVGSSDEHFYGLELDERTGQLFEFWPPFKTEGKIWATPEVVGGVAYFGNLDHKLYALDVETWQEVWSEPFEAGGAFISSPKIVDGRLYIGSMDRKMYALDASTGLPVWAQAFEADSWFWAKPVSDGNRVYVGNMDGFLYALDVTSGKLVWKFDTGGPVMVPPLITEQGLMVASDSGRVWFLDRERGEQMSYLDDQNKLRLYPRFFDVGDPVRAPLLLGDGAVYLFPMSNTIVSLDPKRGTPFWSFSTESE